MATSAILIEAADYPQSAMVATIRPARRERKRQPPIEGLAYDPQDYRSGPLAVLAIQLAVVIGFVFGFGVLADLHLPPSLGVLPFLVAFPALALIPRTTLMQFPVSLSALSFLGLIVLSYTWTIDPVATYYTLLGTVPAMVVMALAGGLLSENETMAALLWAFRVTLLLTIVALVVSPAARTHVSTDPYLPDYPGWHGWFSHKNELTPILVIAVPTVLIYDRSRFSRWLTLAVIGVLLLGSASVTGITAAAFAAVVWFWLRIYSGQADTRDRTLYLGVTVLGGLTLLLAVVASVATITSAYGKDTSFSGRTDIWEAAVAMVAARPLLGYGYGGLFWQNPVGSETLEIWRLVGFHASHAHSGPLNLALQLGLIGLGLFLLMWSLTFRAAWKAVGAKRNLAVWALTLLLANLLMAFSEKVFFGAWVGLFVMAKLLLMRRREFVELADRRVLSERLRP